LASIVAITEKLNPFELFSTTYLLTLISLSTVQFTFITLVSAFADRLVIFTGKTKPTSPTPKGEKLLYVLLAVLVVLFPVPATTSQAAPLYLPIPMLFPKPAKLDPSKDSGQATFTTQSPAAEPTRLIVQTASTTFAF
jgi:hypothetical protein